MKFITPTKQQIVNGVVKPFIVILSYCLGLIKNKEITAEVVQIVKDAVDEINVETVPTTEDAVRAGLQILDTAAETTETKIDDAVVDAGKLGADFVFKRGNAFSTIIGLLKLRKKAKS